MLNNLLRLSEPFRMPVACYFQPVNEGAIEITPAGSRLTAIGRVFELYKRHIGGRIIGLDGRRTIGECEAGAVDIAASYDENTGRITVTCVNKTGRDVPLAFTFDGFGEPAAEEALELTAEDIAPGHTWQERVTDGLSVSKHSILRLTFKAV
jgi:alpha-L-arabinofuranosidase